MAVLEQTTEQKEATLRDAQGIENAVTQRQDKGFASLTQGQKDLLGGREIPILSTKQAGRDVAKAEETIAGMIPEPKEVKEETKAPPKEEVKDSGGFSALEISAVGGDLSDFDKQADGKFIKKGEKTEADIQLEKKQAEAEEAKKEKDFYDDKLQNFDVSNDPALQGIVKGISGIWNTRIRQMEEINKSRGSALTQRGFRTGGRFTTSFGGIITAEERAGMSRIGDLESQKQNAIANAKSAFASQKWSQFVTLANLAQNNYNAQIEEMQKLNELAIEQSKKVEEEVVKSKLSDSVYNSIQLLGDNATAQNVFFAIRKAGIDTTIEEVSKAFKAFTPEKSKDTSKNAYEFTNADTGKLISAGFSGEDIQATQDIFNKYGLYSPIDELDGKSLADSLQPKQLSAIKNVLFPVPVDKGKGLIDGKTYDDLTTGTRLGKMIYGTRIANEETKRIDSIIELGKAQGKDEFDIMDDILGYRITPEHKSMGDGLRFTMMTTGGKDGLLGFDVIGVARLINAGEYLGAVRKIENTKMLEVQNLVGRENFVAEADVDYINNKVKDINDLLGEGWTDEVGAFGGNFTTWLSKKFGHGQATKIKAKVTAITADMVNKRAGSAITETEWEKIVAPNVPAMNDSPEAFKDKLEELVGDTLERYNSERNMVSLPSLTKGHISDPESRTVLYSADTDPNPANLELSDSESDPFGLGI